MKNKKLLIAGIVLAIAVTGLIYNTALKTSAAYLQVSTFKIKAQSGELRKGQPVKLIGKVAKGSVERKGSKIRFDVVEKNQKVAVVYEGLVPDAFAEGREVILDGAYSGEPFEATHLIAKCPSKYKAEDDNNKSSKP